MYKWYVPLRHYCCPAAGRPGSGWTLSPTLLRLRWRHHPRRRLRLRLHPSKAHVTTTPTHYELLSSHIYSYIYINNTCLIVYTVKASSMLADLKRSYKLWCLVFPGLCKVIIIAIFSITYTNFNSEIYFYKRNPLHTLHAKPTNSSSLLSISPYLCLNLRKSLTNPFLLATYIPIYIYISGHY